MTWARSIVITAGVGLAVALCACGNGPPEVAAGGGGPAVGTAGTSLGTAATKITADSANQFSPGTSTAATGQVVQWTVASDSVPHNITFDSNPELSSPASLGPGETWEVKFSVAGTYAYHCTIHSGMNGQITVSQGSGSGSTGSSSSGASTAASANPTP
jgi:plastocyanin